MAAGWGSKIKSSHCVEQIQPLGVKPGQPIDLHDADARVPSGEQRIALRF